MNLWKKIKCATGHHELKWVKALDDQLALWKCDCCNKEFAHRFRTGAINEVYNE